MENLIAHEHHPVRGSADAEPVVYSSGLHRYTLLLAVCTLFLVVAGALVTSNQAGLSVPDWPLSYGKVMPPMTGGVFFEHGHRMVATTVGMLTVILAIWLARKERRPWMRKLGWAALGAVVLQGLLGGLTVLLLLPPAVSVSHACLAQLFFSTTVALAVFTSRSWQKGPQYVDDSGWPPMRFMAIFTPAAVLAQIALGAAFRHRAISVLPHIIGAMVVSLIVLMTAISVIYQFPRHEALRKSAKALLALTFVQVFLGLLTYFVGSQVEAGSLAVVLFTVAHVATGALTLASSVLLGIHIRRNVRVPAAETATTPQTAVAQ